MSLARGHVWREKGDESHCRCGAVERFRSVHDGVVHEMLISGEWVARDAEHPRQPCPLVPLDRQRSCRVTGCTTERAEGSPWCQGHGERMRTYRPKMTRSGERREAAE